MSLVCFTYEALGANEPTYFLSGANQNPVLVSSDLFQHALAEGFFGPLSHNGNLYSLSTLDVGGATGGSIVVYKSTDSGATWTDISSASLPGTGVQATNNFWDSTSGVLHVMYASGGLYRMIDFDIETELFGTPYGTSGGPTNSGNIPFVQRSNGDFLMYQVITIGITPTLVVSICQHNGSWSSVHSPIVATPAGFRPLSVVIDSSDVTHILIGDGAINSCQYVNVDNSGSASAFVDFLALGFLPPAINVNRVLIFLGTDGKLYLPVPYTANAPINVLVGTTPFTSGSWTSTSVNLPGTDVNSGFTWFSDFDLPTFWVSTKPNTGTLPNRLYYSQLSGGSWGTPAVFWDDSLNPTPQGSDPSNPFAIITFSVSPSPTSLSLACPTGSNSLTVGTPYSGTLVVSGGTPPYTFALISGSLPPGLTLNTSTGVISGTPTSSGSFSYTVQVTDSTTPTPLSAHVTCMFTVGAPGPPSPPASCELNPIPTFTPTLAAYGEPDELSGS